MTEELAYFVLREMNLGGKTNKEMTCIWLISHLKNTTHSGFLEVPDVRCAPS